ncbi:uncharacterized protein LOC118756600 [Rhagoletis pomonella]|uniref:uncharacterized protein LOC118756600 n=1 Tax=Rhagoletis pomonella TaxID=28610 RepID=UPI00177D4281|nr:uncharacterized protein LOC118756600 [Rhagoletis pomonella]
MTIESPTATVLGLRWDAAADELFFKVDLKESLGFLTKRRVLSAVAKLFDPTGILAPVVITGKIFIQRLWAAGLSWDEPLPDELQTTWVAFYSELDVINKIRIPRWLGMAEGRATTLLGFCDASTLAYAAVIYIRATDAEGHSAVSLLTARTKVAPLKGATIPRLELCAAHLLAVTLENVRISLRLTDTPYYLWSDSRIVLCWLRKPPTTLKPFVSNRVHQIHELTSPNCWHYVRSAQNPADCASRGIRASQLLDHPLWWQGPGWIMDKHTPNFSVIELNDEEHNILQSEQRVSSFVATTTHQPALTTRRRDGQMIPLIDLAQIRKGTGVSSSSKLKSLNPYMDDTGVLRVGGRISKADLPEDRRFPIILPKHGRLVELIIRHAHETTLHGGPQLVLQTLRSRYWILNGRQAVRSYGQKCVICRRHRGVTLSQQMASLPRQRISTSRAFVSSGVDYCGPFTVRVGAKRSRTKVLWYNQLQTLAARIEACLNSRPITPLYDDPNDKLALTPGDFLIGAPLIAVPEATVTAIPSNRIKQWLWVRHVHQKFWQRWSEEYLSTLQTRNKWQKPTRDVRRGDVVLVRNENLAPTHWRLGRITEIHPGSDGLTRNVTLRTASGTMTRAVQKLCRLLDSEHFESTASTGQDVQNSTDLATT